MSTLNSIPEKNIADYVAALARRSGVKPAQTQSDALANVITRLSDNEVATDTTEDLIVALKLAGKISGPEMVQLLGRHLDEKFHV